MKPKGGTNNNGDGRGHSNGNNPGLAGWFMLEPLNERVLRRVHTVRAWRERNALIGGLVGDSWKGGPHGN